MEKIETIQDINNFIHTNREKLLERAIDIKDLPMDDDWIQDDEWDETIMEKNDDIVAFVKAKCS